MIAKQIFTLPGIYLPSNVLTDSCRLKVAAHFISQWPGLDIVFARRSFLRASPFHIAIKNRGVVANFTESIQHLSLTYRRFSALLLHFLAYRVATQY